MVTGAIIRQPFNFERPVAHGITTHHGEEGELRSGPQPLQRGQGGPGGVGSKVFLGFGGILEFPASF